MKNPQKTRCYSQDQINRDFARFLISCYEKYHNSFSFLDGESVSSYKYFKNDRVWFSSICHYGGNRIKWHLLQEMYLEGFKVRGILKCSFLEFCNYIVRGIPQKIYNYTSDKKQLNRRIHWRWRRKIWFIQNKFRVPQKFRSNRNIRKKIKSEKDVNKVSWHTSKGHHLDKKKCGYRRRRSCPKSYKKMFNKEHRQWQRDNLNKGNWEELSNYKKWKEIANPWRYD
jgi:hypothetical protein